ncbi:MAG TPA: FAD:protein FMN transferase, partial [Planctomycetaceae bacterium]
MSAPVPNRRDVLTGRALRAQVEVAQEALAAAVLDGPETPRGGPSVRLAVRAMGTEFGVLLNPGPAAQITPASEALDLVAALERQLTVYRDDSEVSRLNATAAGGPVAVERNLFDLLSQCEELTRITEGAFDAATHAQIALWQRCRREDRLPTDDEVADALARSGMRHVRLDPVNRTVAFDRPGVGFNFGAIGKGYALDRCAELLGHGPFSRDRQGSLDALPSVAANDDSPLTAHHSPPSSFCLHGGHSSVLARGDHNGTGGWPVGIGNPLFTSRRLGTILLKDRALGTSGSNIQFYRHGGKRYGHILDPRTARPTGELLSVTVVAPTAAIADALSTAFFVLGVE